MIGRLAAYMGPLFNWEGLAVRVSPYKSPEREGTCHTRTTPLLTSPHTSPLPPHYSTATTPVLHFWCSCLTKHLGSLSKRRGFDLRKRWGEGHVTTLYGGGSPDSCIACQVKDTVSCKNSGNGDCSACTSKAGGET